MPPLPARSALRCTVVVAATACSEPVDSGGSPGGQGDRASLVIGAGDAPDALSPVLGFAPNGASTYLVCDEMTTMRDASITAARVSVLQDYRREHKAGVLAISHDEALLRQWADAVCTLDDAGQPA